MASDEQAAPATPKKADEIEKQIVHESIAAGVPAAQLDPNATPAEKAEQAKAAAEKVLPPEPANASFTQLEASSANGADKSDQQAADSPKQSPARSDSDGQSVASTAVVTRRQPEDPFARDRTGWAPRFFDEEKDGVMNDNDATLIDHQTWLETAVDDKFYGDWYHNAAVIVFACLASWFIALIGGGLGWVLIIMATCGTYYRTSVRRVRRNFRDDVSREMAKNRLETDVESLEWINSFLVKFWPIYSPVFCDMMIGTVDQVLDGATPGFLDSLRLKTFTLGSKPPRLEHVKTYPTTDPDIVMMDWKFSFTPMDTMDMTARQLKHKVNPKVVLEVRLGKGVVSKGMDVIVEDFQCSALLRFKAKLQLAFPHVERVDVSFLGRPEIDYVCKPLGGDMLGFDINFIPGLESFIKDMIHSILGPMMYDPNVFSVEIAKMLANSAEQALGVVAITVHGARNLRNTDAFSGTPDPYVVASLNHRHELARTRTITGDANPKWGETMFVVISSYTDALTLPVYDFNDFRKDKELGVATFALDQLEQQPDHENLSLEVLASGRSRGVLNCDVHFFPVLKGQTLENGTVEPPPEMNTGILRYTVEQAKELDSGRSIVGKLNPYAVLMHNGREVKISKKLKRTNDPVFQNSSHELLITDRKTARIGLMIKDDRDLAHDPIVGRWTMKVTDMLRAKERGQEWFNLAGAKSGRVKIMVDWKPVALRGDLGASGGYVTPVGVMRVHILNARDLRNVETMGKSDPYCRVMMGGFVQARTVTFQNNLDPDWDEVFYVPVHSAREKLVLEVLDEENVGKDRTLGQIEVNVAKHLIEGEDGEYLAEDKKEFVTSPLKDGRRGTSKGTLNYAVSFFPIYNVADAEEEAEEKAAQAALEKENKELAAAQSAATGAPPPDSPTDSAKGAAKDAAESSSATAGESPRPKTASSEKTTQTADKDESSDTEKKPKLQITPQNLAEYQSGLLVFRLEEVNLGYDNVQLEVLMDNHNYPSYTSPKVKNRRRVLNDTGNCFVRELDMSRITLRIAKPGDDSADDKDRVLAKLTGPTLQTLQNCLNTSRELSIRGEHGVASKVVVNMKYIPVQMVLDPEESINNEGQLRISILDAADLPSADRNGYSDPYCKLVLNEKEFYKTKVQKKTLHPSWNEFCETPVSNRIRAKLKLDVYDWDFGEKADYLGGAWIDIAQLVPFQDTEMHIPLDGKSGVVRLSMLFSPSYVARTRQGTSTLSGTFAVPGKIIGAPVKGVGFVGGNVVKGASFIKHGVIGRIRSGSNKDKDDGPTPSPSLRDVPTISETPPALDTTVSGASSATVNASQAQLNAPVTPTMGGNSPSKRFPGSSGSGSATGSGSGTGVSTPHKRSPSSASTYNGSTNSTLMAAQNNGTANFSVISATGYPPSAKVYVTLGLRASKGDREVHKTKHVKASETGPQGPVHVFDRSHESFRVPNVTADQQYVLQVKDHSTFGSDEMLAETMLFVDDQGSSAGKERAVKCGGGFVVLTSSFEPAGGSAAPAAPRPSSSYSVRDTIDSDGSSPDSKKAGPRRLFSRRVSGGHGSGAM
ncbi:hypothetical protein KEM52_006133 [Ascosphaera acerosa]|nr:hypothetical protein KEM52_006133 [Ascosphaera acerosa]